MTKLTIFGKIVVSIFIVGISVLFAAFFAKLINIQNIITIVGIYIIIIIIIAVIDANRIIYFFISKKSIRALEIQISRLNVNLSKRNQQISKIRGQMHRLKEVIIMQIKEINANIELAEKAKNTEKKAAFILKQRENQRKQSVIDKLESDYKMLEIVYRILSKVYENTEVIYEDTKSMRDNATILQNAKSQIFSDSKSKIKLFDESKVLDGRVQTRINDIESYLKLVNHFPLFVNFETGFLEKKKILIFRKKYPKNRESLIKSIRNKDLIFQPLEKELLDLLSL